MTTRRDFLRGAGVALYAASSGVHAIEGEEVLTGSSFKVEPFVQVGITRIVGAQDLLEQGWELTIRSEGYPSGNRFRLGIKNLSTKARSVDYAGVSFSPPQSGGSRQWRVFLDSGRSGWCGVKRLDDLAPDEHLQPTHELQTGGGTLVYHLSDMESVIWDAGTGAAVLAGFLRQRHGRNFLRIIPEPVASDIQRLEAVQELGFEIEPASEQPLDPLVVSMGSDPYSLLELYGDAVARYHGKPFNGPPIVGMMTWYGYRTAIDEKIVVENARLIAELFSGYPQEMQILMLCDHGWQQDANWGYWQPDEKRFPHGIKWLSEQLQNMGLSLGLWYTPFCITGNALNYAQLIPLESLDPQGKAHTSKACVWGQLPGQSDCMPISFLDGGKPAVQEIWRKTLSRMKEWGTKYWKLDFFNLRTSTSEQRKLGVGDLYAKTYQSFRAAAGDESLNPCSCDTNLQVGYCDSTRIAADIGNAGDWSDTVQGFRRGMGTIAALWFKHRKFWINDPDSVQIGKGCSLAEARVRATVVSMSGGHLMLSEDLRTIDPERLEIIRRLLPVYPHAARPLDLFAHPFPDGYPALWALSVPAGFGPKVALAVFNLGPEPQKYAITAKMLGIESGREFLAMEWWQYRWLGRFRGDFEVEVPAGDVAMIHAQPRQEYPSLLSVSHHFTGGYIVENVEFDPSSGIMKGVLATKPGLRLVLFGTGAGGWKLASRETYHSAENSWGGWQSEVATTGPRTPFALQFQRQG